MSCVEIRTELLPRYRYVVRVFVDGELSESHMATLGSVVKVRNRAADHWSSQADVSRVEAGEIPWAPGL